MLHQLRPLQIAIKKYVLPPHSLLVFFVYWSEAAETFRLSVSGKLMKGKLLELLN